MLEILLEWCADVFGMTAGRKLNQLLLFCGLMFVLGMPLAARWGSEAWVIPLGMVTLAAFAARQIDAARNAVWRSACLGLEDPAQRPSHGTHLRTGAPTMMALMRLAEAVDLVRRDGFTAAMELVPLIQRDLLRPEEAQLLDAVRAMISVGLGSTDRAARQAASALPTGSHDLDLTLGRTMIMEAWNDAARLEAIRAAWKRAGVDAGPLERLTRLTRLRIDTDGMEGLAAGEARDLSDEARAIGDDELAAELDAKGRPNAYR